MPERFTPVSPLGMNAMPTRLTWSPSTRRNAPIASTGSSLLVGPGEAPGCVGEEIGLLARLHEFVQSLMNPSVLGVTFEMRGPGAEEAQYQRDRMRGGLETDRFLLCDVEPFPRAVLVQERSE